MMNGETVLTGATSHEQDPRVSPFKVMRSGAGWYIGTDFTHDGTDGLPKGFVEPNTRETEYFRTEHEAEVALDHYRATGQMPMARRAGYNGHRGPF